MPSQPVLMRAQNPQGWKLEELLEVLQEEIRAKTQRVKGDPRPEAQSLVGNNIDICARLRECALLQRHSLKVLEGLGPDQGPTGKPRVGEGS